jgi:chromosome partitioning protein
VSVTAGTVEQPTGQQPDGDKGLRWQVSTSGMARKGLGWPVDTAGDDSVLKSGLGWPGSTFGSVHKLVQSSITDAVDGSVYGSLPDGADRLVPGSAPTLVPEPALGSGPGGADTLVPGSAPTLVPETAPRPAQELVAEPILGAVPDSVLRPSAQSDTDHPKATGGDSLPTADLVSRETASQGGVEQLSERDQLAASLPKPGSETPLAQAVAEDARRRLSLSGKALPKPDHTRILTVANQKGGVGKTTTTVNIAAALAQAGLRVLVVDIDPQGNASTALGIDHHADVPSIYDVLVDGKAIVEVVQECVDISNLWCVPATIDLAGAEIELVSLVARETRMERALTAYIRGAEERGEERLDYVLIDCPPSLGLLTVNAFVAADEVFIPIQCEYYALEGLSQLLKNIELIKSHLNPGLHVSTILLTMYDGRTRLSAQVAEEVRTHFPNQVLRTSVPRSVRISEAPSFGQTVMTYDPTSSGALSYLEAASELADRGAAVEVVGPGAAVEVVDRGASG